MDINKVKQNLLQREARNRKKREAIRNGVLDLILKETGLFEKYGIQKAYIYGSLLSGRFHPGSDVDIAIDGDITFKNILRLHSELSNLLSMDVDVRPLNELPFKETIRKNGLIIYERKDIAS